MLNLETHAHSEYCRRNGTCRFGFPKPPSPKTLISHEPDDNDNEIEKKKRSQEVLAKIYSVLESSGKDLTLDELLQEANISEFDYFESLKISCRGKNVILKRNPSDVFTNGCNLEILKLWKGDMDFQLVVDEYTTVMYIYRYMMKSEKALGRQLKMVAKECQSDDIAKQLKK